MNKEVTTIVPRHGGKKWLAFIRYALNPDAFEAPKMDENVLLRNLHCLEVLLFGHIFAAFIMAANQQCNHCHQYKKNFLLHLRTNFVQTFNHLIWVYYTLLYI